jgi:Phosphodiester glycosidase
MSRTLFCAVFVLLLVACADDAPPPRVASLVTLYPTASASSSESTPPTSHVPDALALYDGQWRAIKPGIEQLALRGRITSGADKVDELIVIARIDPKRVQLKVQYAPTSPQHVRAWLESTQADVVINGGYFDEQNVATALVVVDGAAIGKSYSGFGGLFALRGSTPSLQWLKAKPYRPDPRITYALQGSPMLVYNGRMVPGISDNGARSRRSFVAIDQQGRVLLGICQFAQWTLTDLAKYLSEASYLQIQNALNLDGGASTGLWIRGGAEATMTDSFDKVPVVIVGIGE